MNGMTTADVKPRLFSRQGIKALGEAFNFKKYGPKEWGVWCLSSLFSDLKYVLAGVGIYLWGMLPATVANVIKSVAFKIAAVVVATFEIVVAG